MVGSFSVLTVGCKQGQAGFTRSCSVARLVGALPLLERTLADRARVLGDTHPHTLTSRDELAGAYQVAGRVAEAIPLFERALADFERVLGITHPTTLIPPPWASATTSPLPTRRPGGGARLKTCRSELVLNRDCADRRAFR